MLLNGSLRLNLTQHGETHQVNKRLLQGLGLEQRDEFASAAINSCGEAPYFGHERPSKIVTFCSATPAGTGDASSERERESLPAMQGSPLREVNPVASSSSVEPSQRTLSGGSPSDIFGWLKVRADPMGNHASMIRPESRSLEDL